MWWKNDVVFCCKLAYKRLAYRFIQLWSGHKIRSHAFIIVNDFVYFFANKNVIDGVLGRLFDSTQKLHSYIYNVKITPLFAPKVNWFSVVFHLQSVWTRDNELCASSSAQSTRLTKFEYKSYCTTCTATIPSWFRGKIEKFLSQVGIKRLWTRATQAKVSTFWSD